MDHTSSSTSTSSRRMVIWIGASALLLMGLSFVLDSPTRAWVNEAPGWIVDASRTIAKYGDWPWLMAAAAPVLLFAWVRARSELFRLVAAMMIASTLTGVAVNVVRGTTGRTRPNADAEQGWYGLRHDGEWLVGRHQFNSFPSAHTAAAIGLVGPVVWAKPVWGVPLLVVAATVPASRMLTGHHHFSDVIASGLAGLLIGWWVWARWGRRGRWLDRLHEAPRARCWLAGHGGRYVGLKGVPE